MVESFTCWKCGNTLTGVILPMSRREECHSCTADQHVCKMCVFYDNRGRCDEERAEDVSDYERANFCDYFKPKYNAFYVSTEDKSAAAKAKFAELFGDPIPEDIQEDESLTPAERAEKKLRDMLG